MSDMTTGPAATAPPWSIAAASFAAWRGGDRSALDRLVRQLTPVLWQISRAYGLDRAAAEDAVQLAWLALVRNADGIHEPEAVWRWLTTTTRREAWRIAARADTVSDAALAEEPDTAPGPESHAEHNDLAARLWQHVSTLPERCRRLLRIVAFEQRPHYAELSAELGMSIGGIGPTRARCLEKLRRRLADDPGWSN
jgi:RNA polymerase sigma factor (sigma-70 family)